MLHRSPQTSSCGLHVGWLLSYAAGDLASERGSQSQARELNGVRKNVASMKGIHGEPVEMEREREQTSYDCNHPKQSWPSLSS